MHSTPSVVDTDRFSLDTESGFKDVVFVTSAYGLGETVVGGTVNPDEWCLGHERMRRDEKCQRCLFKTRTFT